jgi:hypothetical protein
VVLFVVDKADVGLVFLHILSAAISAIPPIIKVKNFMGEHFDNRGKASLIQKGYNISAEYRRGLGLKTCSISKFNALFF